MIYLDSNACYPLRQETGHKLIDWIQDENSSWANPSSSHAPGRRARRAIQIARDQVTKSLGASQYQILFTGSATEANQWLVKAHLERFKKSHPGIQPIWALSRAEHECHLKLASHLEETQQAEILWLELSSDGQILTDAIARLNELQLKRIALVTLIWAHNLTGAVIDSSAWAKFCQERALPLHLDGAQAWGKMPVELDTLGVNAATFSSMKIGAPSGVGVIAYHLSAPPLEPHWLGTQEQGLRGGTENLIGIRALGATAELLNPARFKDSVAPLNESLRAQVQELNLPITILEPKLCIPNTTAMIVSGVRNDELVARLDLAGFAVSAGSACTSGVVEASQTLLAMGYSVEQAKSCIRISFNEQNSLQDVQSFVSALQKEVSAR